MAELNPQMSLEALKAVFNTEAANKEAQNQLRATVEKAMAEAQIQALDFFKDVVDQQNVNSAESQDKIAFAYKKMALLFHPDRNRGDDKAFKELQKAREQLKKPVRDTQVQNDLGPKSKAGASFFGDDNHSDFKGPKFNAKVSMDKIVDDFKDLYMKKNNKTSFDEDEAKELGWEFKPITNEKGQAGMAFFYPDQEKMHGHIKSLLDRQMIEPAGFSLKAGEGNNDEQQTLKDDPGSLSKLPTPLSTNPKPPGSQDAG
jgi:curved DNA-binding protein CbpA